MGRKLLKLCYFISTSSMKEKQTQAEADLKHNRKIHFSSHMFVYNIDLVIIPSTVSYFQCVAQ